MRFPTASCMIDRMKPRSGDSGMREEEMNLKKLGFVLCALLLVALTATAMATTLEPLPVTVDTTELSDLILNADVVSYNDQSDTLFLDLWEMEPFDLEEVNALEPGDSIVIGGETVEIETIDPGEDYTTINKKDGDYENAYFLYRDEYGNFTVRDSDDYPVMRQLGEVACTFSDEFYAADGVDPESGEMLDSPTELDKEGFLSEIGDDIGFNHTNTKVYFDGEGNVEYIEREYTPWQ